MIFLSVGRRLAQFNRVTLCLGYLMCFLCKIQAVVFSCRFTVHIYVKVFIMGKMGKKNVALFLFMPFAFYLKVSLYCTMCYSFGDNTYVHFIYCFLMFLLKSAYKCFYCNCFLTIIFCNSPGKPSFITLFFPLNSKNVLVYRCIFVYTVSVSAKGSRHGRKKKKKKKEEPEL